MTKKTYTVGYKKPPVSGQFKPGQSGNPTGRPKGVKNLTTDLSEELEEKITVTEDGQTRELTKQRAMIKTLMAKALKGDSRASNVLIGLALSLEQTRENQDPNQMFAEDDLAILENLKKRLISVNEDSSIGSREDEAAKN